MKITISTPSHGVLWERPIEEGNRVVIDREDNALLAFLIESHEDVTISVLPD